MMRVWLCIGILACMIGCGSEKKGAKLPEAVPVAGVVTLNGAPLPKATVIFLPTGDTKGTGSQGVTDATGKYVAQVIHGKEGAVVGSYRVAISKLVLPNGSEIPADSKEAPITLNARDLLPPQYSSTVNSKLTAVVPPGGGTIDFKLSGS